MTFQLTETILDTIADSLVENGYIVLSDQIPAEVCQALLGKVQQSEWEDYKDAAIGRGRDQQTNQQIRSDQISWLSPTDTIDNQYLSLMEQLKEGINRRLYMGLFDFESHYAIYQPGAFYQKHIDALPGTRNRILTSVLFLNPDWQEQHEGKLVIFDDKDHELEVRQVAPKFGKWVVFLSERFPHEVLPTTVNRYSIAGWFRVSSSQHGF